MCYLWRLLYSELISNSSSTDRRHDTDLATFSDCTKKRVFDFRNRQLKEVLTNENKDGKHLNDSKENEQRKRKKIESK